MSDESRQVENTSVSTDDLLAYVEEYYHLPVLAVLAGFMFWLRAQSADRFIQSEEVFFSGNDPWYHYRMVRYTVQNFPATMPFDPWTYFPYGTSVGQFGTLFDQLIATAALIIGLGDPSARLVAEVTVYAPAVFGTLVLFPTYYVGKRLGGRTAGLFAGAALAVIPGLFLARGLAGTADHNVAEPLFQSTAVLATMVALYSAESQRPVFEQFRDGEWAAVREPLGWSVLAGVTTAFYVWMWPPGVLLVGILGVFYFLKLTADYTRGTSPEHVAIVGVVSMSVTTLMTLATLSDVGFTTTRFSLLQPLAAASVAVFAALLAVLARVWDDRDLPRVGYPAAVFGTVLAGVVGVRLLLPSLYGLVERNLVRFVGFDSGAAQRTIGEAQPWLAQYGDFQQAVMSQYGLLFFVAAVGAVLMLFRAGREDGNDGARLLVLVWFAFITAAAFTQVRFNYYLAVPVAVLNGYALYWALSNFGGVPRTATNLDATQVTVIALAVMIVLVPPMVGISGGSSGGISVPTPMQTADQNRPGYSVQAWTDALHWMADNTPTEGNYHGAGNQEALDLYGTYRSDGDYDYPPGYYGVMSWWDYGHWITVQGERIPNANPFQQGATTAANFLLAPNASHANEVLARMDEDDATTRYVMIDAQMVAPGSKFGAPPVFYDDPELGSAQFSDYALPLYFNAGQEGRIAPAGQYVKRPAYYRAMVNRLYKYHGSRVSPTDSGSALVVDWAQNVTLTNGQRAVYADASSWSGVLRSFQNVSAAEAFVRNDSTSQIGGLFRVPSATLEALEQYRMVGASDRGGGGSLSSVGSFTKVFQKVPGATIRGEAPANTTVRASVTMEVPTQTQTSSVVPTRSSTSNFTYVQQVTAGADGEFTMTVPYSTTGYEEYTPEEGYTNVSVRAEGPYTLTALGQNQQGNVSLFTGRVHVTEGQVVGANETASTVTLSRVSGGNGTASSVSLPAGVELTDRRVAS